MTSDDFVEIVNKVADLLTESGITFRSLRDGERRIGEDGFNWFIGLDPDATPLETFIAETAAYIARHGSSVIFSRLEVPRNVAHFDYDSFEGFLKIPAARGIHAWDLIERKMVNRVDFLFMPEMFP